MTDLRKRQPQQRLTKEQREALETMTGVKGYQRAPRPVRKTNRSLHISISLLILACFVIYAQKNKPTPSPYSVNGKKLPQWYAICSRDGRKVYTVPVEEGVGEVECVVVRDKRVYDVGSLAKVRRKYGDKATIGAVDAAPEEVKKQGGLKIIYLQPGHTLTPGLTDSHGHSLQYGHMLQLPLAGTTTKEDVISRVEAYVLSQGGKEAIKDRWVEGMGWDQTRWPVKEFPTIDDLEASPILRGLPIALARIDVHALWVSQAIIDQLGELPIEVDGGHIVRDGSGRPTGIFIDNAMDLVESVRPPWTEAQRGQFLGKMMDDALAAGLTGVHDAMVSESDYRFYKSMADKGKLRMRFYGMVYCEQRDEYCGDKVPQIHGAQDGRLEVRSVKLFADGALGSRGAALLEDYSDQPGWRGLLLQPEEVWELLIRKWHNHGWQVNVHTIGDRASRVAVDAIEKVLDGEPANQRFRLEHSQIFAPGDLERAARLGVIGSYQPTHATSDMWYAEDRLASILKGPERIKGAYAWRSYIKAGGRIALGSDFPVESIDPLKGFYAAVTRLDEKGNSPHGKGGWYPEEKLSRDQTLRGMTVDAAFASMSNDTGSLTPGMRFDAVIWDDDLMHVPEDEMLEVKAVATIVDGRLAHGKIA